VGLIPPPHPERTRIPQTIKKPAKRDKDALFIIGKIILLKLPLFNP
jgi:hypothetical protein